MIEMKERMIDAVFNAVVPQAGGDALGSLLYDPDLLDAYLTGSSTPGADRVVGRAQRMVAVRNLCRIAVEAVLGEMRRPTSEMLKALGDAPVAQPGEFLSEALTRAVNGMIDAVETPAIPVGERNSETHPPVPDEKGEMAVAAGAADPTDCQCFRCSQKPEAIANTPPALAFRMFLCAICGNKRCPHAADHRNACTGSNEPGQPGSLYE